MAISLFAAQGTDDVIGTLHDIPVIEQIKDRQHRVAVLRPEQGPDIPLEAELAVVARWTLLSRLATADRS
jgi:hypothetical protein